MASKSNISYVGYIVSNTSFVIIDIGKGSINFLTQPGIINLSTLSKFLLSSLLRQSVLISILSQQYSNCQFLKVYW